MDIIQSISVQLILLILIIVSIVLLIIDANRLEKKIEREEMLSKLKERVVVNQIIARDREIKNNSLRSEIVNSRRNTEHINNVPHDIVENSNKHVESQ